MIVRPDLVQNGLILYIRSASFVAGCYGDVSTAVLAILFLVTLSQHSLLPAVAIISQGVCARAALGQASSATATSDNQIFDLFGQLALEAKADAEKQSAVDTTTVPPAILARM